MVVRWRCARLMTALMLAVSMTVAVPPGAGRLVAAAGSGEPEMCGGRHDPNITVIGGVRGTTTSPKFILNVVTDAAGVPAGTLVFERDGMRLYVESLCRVWQHLPDQPPGPCMMDGSASEGAITAHAVGIGTLADGTVVLARADARQTDEGLFFRLRWKPMGSGEGGEMTTAAMDGGGGCEDGEWTRYPVSDESAGEEEAWAPLDRLMVKVDAVE